MSNIRDIT